MNNVTLSSQAILRTGRRLRRELLGQDALKDIRIAILGGSTTNELCDFLEIVLLSEGFRPTFLQSEYGAYFEESVLDPSRLRDFRPQIVYVHTSYRNLHLLPTPDTSPEDVASRVKQELDKLRSVWSAVHEHTGAQVIQNNFDAPPHRMLGNLDAVHPAGAARFVASLNAALAEAVSTSPGVLLHDMVSLADRLGRARWSDASRWFSYKLAHTPEAHFEIARSLTAQVRAIYGRARKVLVLDLDNTLWGGVIGDDGVDRIRIGRETAEAEAFTAFHEYCLSLRARGVLLAVCSKNDADVAKTGLAHPDSVLRLEHFSAFRANWQPKHENILSMAEELNLGADSFVFVDDNPAERALVAAQLPMVAVPDVGSDVTRYADIIDDMRYFESVTLSADDLKRAAQYSANSARVSASARFADYGEYLASLTMSAEIDLFSPLYLERIAQLTNKTNQFNLTTRRYSLAEMKAIADDASHIALYGKLTDRFGDNGLVSVLVARVEGDSAEIDLWLMSCRVLKRDMELAMLDVLVERAREQGVKRLRGRFIPTAKNSMVEDHYDRLGFTLIRAEEKSTWWDLPISEYVARSQHITILPASQ
ncbi:MAG: HAD family hydrolase [Gemmatimonadaceae bacterium]|nr:HAD family hydrolase [Gemmatimonadaceae bacterium]